MYNVIPYSYQHADLFRFILTFPSKILLKFHLLLMNSRLLSCELGVSLQPLFEKKLELIIC